MSRISDIFFLDKESILPFEKKIKATFLSEANKVEVWKSVINSVNPTITFGNVVDAMEDIFTISIIDQFTSVENLNTRTIQKISIDNARNIRGMARSREFGFVNGKIPSKMLQRPIFTVEEEPEIDHFRMYN